MLASLNHPHIGAIYGVESFDSGRALILELVEGGTLAERIAATRDSGLRVRDSIKIAQSGSTVRAGSRTLFMQRNIGGGLNGFTVDPSGPRLLLVVPDEKAPSPITVVLNWPSLLARK